MNAAGDEQLVPGRRWSALAPARAQRRPAVTTLSRHDQVTPAQRLFFASPRPHTYDEEPALFALDDMSRQRTSVPPATSSWTSLRAQVGELLKGSSIRAACRSVTGPAFAGGRDLFEDGTSSSLGRRQPNPSPGKEMRPRRDDRG